MTIEKEDYEPYREVIQVPPFDLMEATFSLTPINVFTGQVIDSDSGKPVVGAVVTLNMTYLARTDEQGVFSFTDAPSGSYEVRVGAAGYCAFLAAASLPADAKVFQEYRLTPLGEISVVKIDPGYDGFLHFLDQVDCPVEFNVTVDWG